MKFAGTAAFMIVLLMPRSAAQRQNTPRTTPNKIILRLLNGKNGKPIRFELPNIWVGSARAPVNPRTDAKGEIQTDVSGAEPRTVGVMGNWYVDCRAEGVPLGTKYSIDTILSKGIVTENNCGKAWVEPTPGVLVIYLRPMTFWEKLWL
jgi:hypothetical protein